MKPEDIEPGKSYATRFRVGDYQGLGVIEIRDVEQELFRLRDTETGLRFDVPWQDTWDLDTAEFE